MSKAAGTCERTNVLTSEYNVMCFKWHQNPNHSKHQGAFLTSLCPLQMGSPKLHSQSFSSESMLCLPVRTDPIPYSLCVHARIFPRLAAHTCCSCMPAVPSLPHRRHPSSQFLLNSLWCAGRLVCLNVPFMISRVRSPVRHLQVGTAVVLEKVDFHEMVTPR